MTHDQVILTVIMICGLSFVMLMMGMYIGYQIGRVKGAMEMVGQIIHDRTKDLKP